MTNKDKFIQLVSGEDNRTLADVKKRIKNRAMLRESHQTALKVLMKLDDFGWSQKDLAKAMEVTPQQITKIVSGEEGINGSIVDKMVVQAIEYSNNYQSTKVLKLERIDY